MDAELPVAMIGAGPVGLAAAAPVVGATGFRPDLDVLHEVRLDLDPGIEAPVAASSPSRAG